MLRICARLLALITVWLAGSTLLIAQGVSRVPRDMPGGPAERGTSLRPPAAFGTTEYSVASVFAGSFTSVNPSLSIASNVNSYRYFTSSAWDAPFQASVSIPEGVVIDYIGLNNCDPVGGTYALTLADSTTGPGYTQIGILWSSNNSCVVEYNSTALGYSYPSNAGHNLEIFVTSFGAPTDGSAGFQSVEVWWRRQVSPAPATSDFGDVATSHPFFQFIEALYHSGITAGCGGGNFCPDNPVTRGQMAVFLAKALGLNWPEAPVP